MDLFRSELTWNPSRPRVLVIACSDGRLQEPTDDFLAGHLGIGHYDRLYLPGGGGALSTSGFDHVRAAALRKECALLVHLHGVEEIVVLFHAPAANGPEVAMCADYKRKFPGDSVARLRARQDLDAKELRDRRREWASEAGVRIYRCEVAAAGGLEFIGMDNPPGRREGKDHT